MLCYVTPSPAAWIVCLPATSLLDPQFVDLVLSPFFPLASALSFQLSMRAQSMTAELRRPKSVTLSAFQSEFRKPQLSQDPYEHLDKAYTQQTEKTGVSTAMYRIRGCFDVHSIIMPFLTMTDMVQVRAMSRFSRALMCQVRPLSLCAS
jgi:hypothetical protein